MALCGWQPVALNTSVFLVSISFVCKHGLFSVILHDTSGDPLKKTHCSLVYTREQLLAAASVSKDWR